MLEQFKKDRVAQFMAVAAIILACFVCGLFGYMGFQLVQRNTVINVPESNPPPQVQQAPTPPPVIQSPPTAIPEPTPTTPATATPESVPALSPTLSLEVKLYGVELVDKVSRLNDALDKLEALLQDAQVSDNGWMANLAVQVTVIQAVHKELEGMNPPPEMAHIHNLFLDGTKDCYASMDFLVEGIDKGSTDAVSSAGDLLSSCNDKTYDALKVLRDTVGDG